MNWSDWKRKLKRNKMKRFLLSIFIFPLMGQAQVIIQSGTQLEVSQGTQIFIQTPGNITNNSTAADFINALLSFNLIGGTQTITGDFNLVSFSTSAGGVK